MASNNELRQRLVGEIVDHIQRESLPAGSRLTETGLCQMLRVSRTPVRAALRELAKLGVVGHRPNKGYFTALPSHQIDVSQPSDSDEERFYLKLTRDRFAGRLPNEFMEADIIRRYQVPRKTLTRVLQRLLREQLVEKRPGRGWSFSDMLESEEAHDESYRFRMCIEPAALLEPTFKVDPERLKASQQAHQDVIDGKSGEMSSIEFFQMNSDFHEMLAEFSGNRFFAKAMRRQNTLRRVLGYQWTYGAQRVLETCHEHLAIMSAVEAGDQLWAAHLLREHLSGAAKLTPYQELEPEESKQEQQWRIEINRAADN